jgi:hypothetical protein
MDGGRRGAAIAIATASPVAFESRLCLDLGLHLTLGALLADLIIFGLKRVRQFNE